MKFCPNCGFKLPHQDKSESKKSKSSITDRMSYFLNPEGKEPPE